jgi:hypothetical protein
MNTTFTLGNHGASLTPKLTGPAGVRLSAWLDSRGT